MQRVPLLVNGMLVVLSNSDGLTNFVESTTGILVHGPLLLQLELKVKSPTVKIRYFHLTVGKNESPIILLWQELSLCDI